MVPHLVLDTPSVTQSCLTPHLLDAADLRAASDTIGASNTWRPHQSRALGQAGGEASQSCVRLPGEVEPGDYGRGASRSGNRGSRIEAAGPGFRTEAPF